MIVETADELRTLATKHLDQLLASGFTMAPSLLKWEDRVLLVQSVALHHVLLESKAEIDQFAGNLQHVEYYQRASSTFETFSLCENLRINFR